MKHLQEGGTNLYIDNPGHMTKMATMPIYSEKLQNLLLRNGWTNFNETWHEALMTSTTMFHINHDPVMTLTYFMARSTWVASTFEWGKLLNVF